MNEEIKITPVKIENGVAFKGAVSLTNDELKKRVDFMEKHTEELNKLVIKAESELYIKELLKRNKNLQEELKSANESINWWTNRFKAVEKENQKLNKIIEDIDKYIHIFKIEDIGKKTMLILNDILLIKNGLGKDVVRLNKLTELKKEVE